MTKPRPRTFCLILLAVGASALVPGVAMAAEAGDPSSVLEDRDQPVPANDLHPYRHDGSVMLPIFRSTRMVRSGFWTIETLESRKLHAAVQLGRTTLRDEVEGSVLFIR